ncbi:28S ribosomal protein S15, mitochondrial [Eurytemora carolleeae]|uniref:28S ribosomal protein S15, mitochondrial n=1 Tax=Eurytemora carolleeae TaxID=1294199 RepID=UPI000C759247|nr:28S ribosomal protein S15, mitochondrial [Eurytemora carolleeae]|eukprot:XP_023339752.1 28S ribosomal protein S15, mitochondrial-like [Eurytemora affinis]
MSLLHLVGRTAASSFLINNGSVGRIQVRFRSRRLCDRLVKPADKTGILLGKVNTRADKTIPGVSDKVHPILVQWKRPVRVETCNPELSGDIGGLEHFGEVDQTQPPLELEGCKALAEADAVVQKILSLEYRRRRDSMQKLKRDLVTTVRQHPLDDSSLEVKIATLTVKIRNYHRDLVERYPYKNQPLKHNMTACIALRRRLLEILREQDYRKFEWLLEKLNLFYKPVPHYDAFAVGRKSSIERLTDLWCDELKQHRLDKYKRKLMEDQPKFLRDKADKLKHIMAEEKDLGLEPSVFQEDVDECLRRAVEIENRNLVEENHPQTYLVYQEETVKEQNVFLN